MNIYIILYIFDIIYCIVYVYLKKKLLINFINFD